MADFCKQCSEELFGKDFEDLKGLSREHSEPLAPGEGYIVICEGCGLTVVDEDGKCISDCMKHHDKGHIIDPQNN
jgi:hypothetical protein